MRVAFACWQDRIAPVFDTTHRLLLVEVVARRVVSEVAATLAEDLPVQKVLRLVEWEVGTLVCGAISRPLQELVAAYGIEVIPFVAGDLRAVRQAWLDDRLQDEEFIMPGCCRCRRRRNRERKVRRCQAEIGRVRSDKER